MTQYTGRNFEESIPKLMEYVKRKIIEFYRRCGDITPLALNNLEGRVQDEES